VRPDAVSASVTARASGQRVEVLSQRSETSRSWVNADGTMSSEMAAGPVRFKDAAAKADDGWRDIDLTLVRNADGSVSPTAAPGEVTLSGGRQYTAAKDVFSSKSSSGRVIALGSGLGLDLPRLSWSGRSRPIRMCCRIWT
jgi:hypothetical protein